MMRARKSAPSNVDEENPYWMSFSDIMSALLVIFILASVVLILQLMERQKEFDQRVTQLEKAEQVRRTILQEAQEMLKEQGIRVEVSENHTVLRVPNDLLGFDTGAYELHAQYQATAKEIGEVISQVIRRDDRLDYLDTIFIEGHTDNRPLNGFMGKGNWGLSTFRAISLWQFWASNLPENLSLTTLSNKEGDPLFSVSGYAETRPVNKQQESEADFRVNRRIDIRFTVRRPASQEYEGVRDILGGNL